MNQISRPWRRSLKTVNQEPAPWVYKMVVHAVRPVVGLVSRRTWMGQEHIPQTGPVIIVANHSSNWDAASIGEYIIWSGRWPRFLGKADIWKIPGLRWLATQCQQIPVYRNTERASDALIHAEEALAKGQAVALFPEGTITRDPDMWPMTARRGAAHLALKTGAPVIPIASIGAEKVLGSIYLEPWRIFGRRKSVPVMAGPAIDLSQFVGAEPTKENCDAVTTVIMDTLTEMVAQLKGEAPPEGRWDMRVGRRV